MVPREPFCLLPAYTSWQLLAYWQQKEEEGTESYLQAPILKLRSPSTWLLGILYFFMQEPLRARMHHISPKWRTKFHLLSVKAPNTPCVCVCVCVWLYVTLYMTNKVEKDVRFYDCRISVCLNYTLALLKKRQPIARLHKKHDITNPTRRPRLPVFVL